MLDDIAQILTLAITVYDLAQDAQRNKVLCRNLAGCVQNVGLVLQRAVTVNSKLPEPDKQLEKLLPQVLLTMREVQELVEKASNMGRLRRYLTAASIRSDFQEAYLCINTALTNLSAFASVANLQSRGLQEPQHDEIVYIKKTLQKLEHQTAHPQLSEDVEVEENEVFCRINLAIDRMFHGELGKAEGRTILVNELAKLYSDDDKEGDVYSLLKSLKLSARKSEVKDKHAAFVSHELFEATRLLTLDPPDWCRCPITICVMKDPVLVQGSQSHPVVERGAIEHWFHRGNKKCPITGEPLRDLTLIPVHALRNAIDWWKADQGWIDKDLDTWEPELYQIMEHEQVNNSAIIESNSSDTSQISVQESSSLRSTSKDLDKRLIKAAKDGKTHVVEDCIHMGANVNATDSTWFQYTALHWAATNGHVNAVRALLAAGIYIDAKDQEGRTALWRGARYGRLSVIEPLVTSGADLNVPGNYFGTFYTPLGLAIKKQHLDVARFLAAHGALER